jgi:hypothetical protein
MAKNLFLLIAKKIKMVCFLRKCLESCKKVLLSPQIVFAEFKSVEVVIKNDPKKSYQICFSVFTYYLRKRYFCHIGTLQL